MTRIKYRSNSNQLEAGPFFAGNQQVEVYIDRKPFEVSIKLILSKHNCSTIKWHNVNISDAKVSTKNYLKQNGVQFLDEIRPGRSNGN